MDVTGSSHRPTLRHLSRRTRRAAALAAAAAVAVGVSACGGEPKPSPEAATRDFLEAAVVQGNGETACGYLTTAERGAAERASASPGTTCREALDDAVLSGPSGPVTTESAVKQLPMTVHRSGARAAVTIRTAAGPRVLRLVDAGAAGSEEFDPPATPWRISSGVEALLGPQTTAVRDAPSFHGQSARVAAAIRRLDRALSDGDVAELCRPGVILTAALVTTLGGAGGGTGVGDSCEASVESLIERVPVPPLVTTDVALEPDLAVARVHRQGGGTIPVTLLREGRRWLVSFTGDTVPLDALVHGAVRSG